MAISTFRNRILGTSYGRLKRVGTLNVKVAEGQYLQQAQDRADADSGLVHSLHTTAANESDIAHTHEPMHGQESMAFLDAGYIGVAKRDEIVDLFSASLEVRLSRTAKQRRTSERNSCTDQGVNFMLIKKLAMWTLFSLVAGAAHAQGARVDAKGGADHPLISRYSGSWLIGWRKQDYADAKPLAMLTDDIAAAKKLDRNVVVEGQITELFYVAPAGRTALEVQRNYEDALKGAGASLVYSCRERDWGCYTHGGPAVQMLLNYVVPKSQQANSETQYQAFGAPSENLQAAVFTLNKGGVNTWVTVYTVDAGSDVKTFANSASTYLQIIQPKSMDSGQVKVFDASQIAKALGDEGKLALYGIYFDTGSAVLKPQSDVRLAEMARLLKSNAALRVFIVGHTDNQGTFDANLLLSQKRAEAVVAAVVSKHGIDAKRLSAKGAANIAPVASNTAEAGRAKNRRVELVAQ